MTPFHLTSWHLARLATVSLLLAMALSGPALGVAIAAPAAFEASFRDLPGSARRGEQVSIRVDVTDGATCQGSIIYDDGRSQALTTQTASRQRCRWDVVVAADAPYGPARVALTVTQGTGQTTLMGSFEI